MKNQVLVKLAESVAIQRSMDKVLDAHKRDHIFHETFRDSLDESDAFFEEVRRARKAGEISHSEHNLVLESLHNDEKFMELVKLCA